MKFLHSLPEQSVSYLHVCVRKCINGTGIEKIFQSSQKIIISWIKKSLYPLFQKNTFLNSHDGNVQFTVTASSPPWTDTVIPRLLHS